MFDKEKKRTDGEWNRQMEEKVISGPERRETMEKKKTDNGDGSVTTIGEGTQITGNIRAENDLIILGEVEGDAVCMADMQVKGKVHGNITAENLVIDRSEVRGDIKCSSRFELKGGTELLGGIEAGTAGIEGCVKGNVVVREKIRLSSQARIEGDIQAGTIEVEEGAEIEGSMKIGKRQEKKETQQGVIERKISGGYVKRAEQKS